LIPSGFIAAGLIPSHIALRRLHLPGRLDAAERTAKFIDLAFIGELLTLSQFNEFQNLIQLVDRVLQRLGDLGRMQNCLVDGGSCCRPEISRLHPLLGTLRLRPAFRRTVSLRLRLLLRLMPILWLLSMLRGFPLWCGGMFFGRLRHGWLPGFRFIFRSGKISRFLGMRLAKTTGVFSLRGFGSFGRLTGGNTRFRGVGHVFTGSGRGGLVCRRTRATGAATATTTATAAIGGASRGCGRLQIGLFVWHRFSVRMTVPAGKSKAN
jgi:hypothetical protein